MIGERVKFLRDQKGWSQAHLAEVAGLSERTVQRVESTSAYSGETAMALAAAFDIEVRDLTQPLPSSPGEYRPLWHSPSALKAARIALVLAAPGALFILCNTLDYLRITSGPLTLLNWLARLLGLAPNLWFLWPVPLLIAPAIGLIIILLSSIRPVGRVEHGGFAVVRIEFSSHPLALAAFVLCSATMFAPAANIVAETLVAVTHGPAHR